MALYIDVGFGDSDQVFADLVSLTGGQGDLGEVNVSGFADMAQVTYASPGTDAVSGRIKALVDHPTGNVVVSGVPSSFGLPDGNLISAVAGETFTDTASDGEQVIRVIYDVEMCNGSGYWVDGQSGSRIDFPRAIILYHELSHAWHFANGTVAGTPAAEEQAAETDENVARTEKGEKLRLVTSHNGGCGSPDPTGNPWQIDCFVVSAALGSAAQPAVDALRLVRDLALRALPEGHSLFDDLYREYYSYSPAIAHRMWLDPALRDAGREALVLPLLRVYAVMLDVLRVWPETGPVEAVLADALARTAAAGPPPSERAAGLVRAVLLGDVGRGDVVEEGLLGGWLGSDGLPLTWWAIVRPLRTYWRARLGLGAPSPRDLREGIAAWWLERSADATTTVSGLGSRVSAVEDALVGGSLAWRT